MKDRIIADLTDVWAECERRHPDGYPCTRNGIRLGLAAAEDEYWEAKDEWDLHKRHLDDPSEVAPLRGELLQLAAVALMTVAGIDARHPPQ